MRDAVSTRWRNVVVAAAILPTFALGLLAADRHPQGNVGRVIPYVSATIVVWALAIALLSSARRGAGAACIAVAVGLAVVAGYLLLVLPIPYAECGTIAHEWRRATCRSHSELPALIAAALGAPLLAVAGRTLLTRPR